MENKHIAFAKGIMDRYRQEPPGYDYGISVVHRKKKGVSVNVDVHRQLSQMFTREFYQRIRQYENRYYRTVTNQDNRKFIRTLEQIYNQPGEKKQLVHLFKRLGVVTKNQQEWQETRRRLAQYEEELVRLRKQIELQEECVHRREKEEIQTVSVKKITGEVMEKIRQEIRMERLRYGLD